MIIKTTSNLGKHLQESIKDFKPFLCKEQGSWTKILLCNNDFRKKKVVSNNTLRFAPKPLSTQTNSNQAASKISPRPKIFKCALV